MGRILNFIIGILVIVLIALIALYLGNPQSVDCTIAYFLSSVFVQCPQPKDYSDLPKALDTLAREKEFIAGVGQESGPYSYGDRTQGNSDGVRGFEVALINEFARRWFQLTNNKNKDLSGQYIDFRPLKVPKRFDAASSGEVDFVMAAVSNTTQRCTNPKYICSDIAYVQDDFKMLIPVTAIGTITNTMSISTFCDYFSQEVHPIGVITGTTALEMWKDIFGKCTQVIPEPKKFASRGEVIQKLSDEYIAGYITDGRILDFYRNYYRLQDKLVLIELDKVRAKNRPEPKYYKAILNPANDGLRLLIDLTLMAMKLDGTFKGIYEQYFHDGHSDMLIREQEIAPMCPTIEKYWLRIKDPDDERDKFQCQ